MTKVGYYDGLNEDSKFTIQVDIPTLAKEVCDMNYGAHRLLSAMVVELRRKHLEYWNNRKADDDKLPENRRLNLSEEDKKSPLADAIEDALNKGFYY